MTPNDEPSVRDVEGDRLVLWLLLAVFFTLLIRTAWLCDDAYITLRVADNFLHGYGLRWNTMERVQAYTHPLWLSVLIVFYWLTGNAYYTAIALSIAISMAA